MENSITIEHVAHSDFTLHGYGSHTLLKINKPELWHWGIAGAHFSPKGTSLIRFIVAENMLDLTSDYLTAGSSQDLGIHVFPPPLQFTLTDCTVCICLQFRAIPLLIMILHHVSEQTHLFCCTGLLTYRECSCETSPGDLASTDRFVDEISAIELVDLLYKHTL